MLDTLWNMARSILDFYGIFKSIEPKTMLFASFGGRNFNDSPKAIYEEVCKRHEFDDWDLIWAFNNPEKIDLPRGHKIQMDSWAFYNALLTSQVWVSNSGMDRGIGIIHKGTIKVETWHGTPLKKIGGDENTGSIISEKEKKNIKNSPLDRSTIRCAQSKYDRDILARIDHATKDSYIMAGLPRNDELFAYSKDKCDQIRESLGINDKKVILYTPTYREYLIDKNNDIFLKPPMDINRWRKELGDKYILLIRAHYAVSRAMGIQDDDFVKDVSKYSNLNDLYAISDMMVSDYSSTFFDYSVFNRPMFCFAYDYEEYQEKRGLYVKLEDVLPCKVCKTEDEVLSEIEHCDYQKACGQTDEFRKKYVPNEGHASEAVVNEIEKRLGYRN